MDTSSKGVKLRVLPTCSGRHTPPQGSEADFGMRLLWEFSLHERWDGDVLE
jgi:hypothetical protein